MCATIVLNQDHVCLFLTLRVPATPALLRIHKSDPVELLESGGQQEVEEELKELESL